MGDRIHVYIYVKIYGYVINTSIHLGNIMVLTKQTVFMAPVAIGWTGMGSMDPFPVPVHTTDAFSEFMYTSISQGKTDGIQYSTTLGTSIRKWVDEESANAYLDYVKEQYFINLGNPIEEGTFIVEDLIV